MNIQQSKNNIVPMPQLTQKTALDTPHSEMLENAVLGAMFTYPGYAERVIAEIGNHNVFFYRHNKILFDAIAATVKPGIKPDVVMVSRHMEKDGTVKMPGCQPSDLTDLIANFHREQTGAVDLGGYINGLKEYYSRWELLKVSDKLNKQAYDLKVLPEKMLQDAQSKLAAVGEFVLSDVFTPLSKRLQQHADHTEHAADRTMLFPTGLLSVDNFIGGLEKQKVGVVAGRKQNGKTSVLLSVGLNVARDDGRVIIFNVADGTYHDVLSRIIAMESGLSYSSVRTGNIEASRHGRYIEAMRKIQNLKLTIRSVKGMTMPQLQSEVRAIAGMNGVDLIIIDYIQRLTVDTSIKGAPRERPAQLAHISQSITKIAEDFDAAVIVGAQINRDGDGKMPSMANIKGSGAIEEDADIVLLVHRDSVYDDTHPYPQQIQVKVAANKLDGSIGTALVKIDALSTYIRSK